MTKHYDRFRYNANLIIRPELRDLWAPEIENITCLLNYDPQIEFVLGTFELSGLFWAWQVMIE